MPTGESRKRAKNFNDLCVPVILGLLILPEDEDEWIHWTSEELLIRGCMYWAEFSSEEVSANSATVNVRLEKKNVINLETLNEMLEKIAKEEWP
ncbi:MAG: DUF4365 domain-containing protein [Lachnospiraceae bacterium]|nr:DUF4365 domain-containing protein [Lachnospiraceae bacterium]